jgi:carboxylesterase
MASSAAKADGFRGIVPVAAAERGRLIGQGDPSPIRVDGKPPAVLAIHGYGGTPLEVELVVDVAGSLGRRALAPLLPGHGTHASDLAATRWSDWLGGAEAAFQELVAGAAEPVVLSGLSLGSLLAIQLAASHPDRVRGLILIANALRLSGPTRWGLELMGAVPKRFDFSLPKLTSDIADPAARRVHLTYSAQPARAAREVLLGGKRAQTLLGKIQCPTLILHGARDRVCPVGNAELASTLVGASDKRVVVFPRSRHILTRDLERAAVRREVRQFLEKLG